MIIFKVAVVKKKKKIKKSIKGKLKSELTTKSDNYFGSGGSFDDLMMAMAGRTLDPTTDAMIRSEFGPPPKVGRKLRKVKK